MDERVPQQQIEGMTRIVLRPLASPLPLAFFAFGAGSLLLGKPLLGLVIALASARFATTGLYELTASTSLQTASGIVGCARPP